MQKLVAGIDDSLSLKIVIENRLEMPDGTIVPLEILKHLDDPDINPDILALLQGVRERIAPENGKNGERKFLTKISAEFNEACAAASISFDD